ncbi:DUF1476 domain-containing protein [Candidatus Bealeia paramacronuclearis]|uniref:DUF1476 domain-containing protein n=1 Tax=Candidatus Bealeia paramacronuclearis TaxID=1921001 RepID=A0ABZ2C7Q4_9PROT|nr:hypothetical protein [Candidatus Bealeia paramacronuclearis]
MDGFNQRKLAFEAKYHHDEEMMFRVTSRRNHLFGLWIAQDILGYDEEAAEAYAQMVISIYFSSAGDAGLISKIHFDLEKIQIDCSQHRLEKALLNCHDQAREEIALEEGIV